MGRKKAFSEAALEKATEAAIRGMKQEAVSLQLKGQHIDPHGLANAEMSVMGVFYNASGESEIISRFRESRFSENAALHRACTYGVSHGLGHLGIRADENHPRASAA